MMIHSNTIVSRRLLSLTRCTQMPYRPEERLPLTPREQRLNPQVEQTFTDEGYPILKLRSSGRNYFAARQKRQRWVARQESAQPRELIMPEDQDWPSVWPTAKTFTPSAVPLPIRQGFAKKKDQAPKDKYANTELIKLANFLHLTPPAIARHCNAIKQFCSEWPKGLETEDQIKSHFPLTYITRDYCHASPSIRDPRSRIVTVQFNIDDLDLEPLDKDKMILLARHRFNPKTRMITINADSCPTKVQNQDYADYLVTALYFESKNHAEWEFEKEE